MKLTLEGIKNRGDWKKCTLPEYDIEAVRRRTLASPEWIHFGCGNIFRGYIARLADDLIAKGEMQTGIIAVDFFNREPIEKVFAPHDDLCMTVGLCTNGKRTMRVIGSIARTVACVDEGFGELQTYFAAPSLKMISLTITEKGYAVRDSSGALTAGAENDISVGPEGKLSTAMGKLCALVLARYRAGGLAAALCSMDNCSRNGEKLRESLLTVAGGWCKKGFADEGFIAYITDTLTFPCSMIDKITPAPAADMAVDFAAMGIEDMAPIVTARGTHLAPYVNAEIPEYLVIEDRFPGERIPLEEAGVYITTLDVVEKTERMKVSACLNPLHTFLAIYGCLLGYKRISDEMADEDLLYLVKKLGFDEGLPVVEPPGIISPEEFLREVIEVRLPNASLPDTPQRIATDTSQKLSVRFGETIKAHLEKGDAHDLTVIPLVIAGWIRYLTGIDDSGKEMALSPDPMLDELRETVRPEWFTVEHGLNEESSKQLNVLLSNDKIFGTDLVKAGLSDHIMALLDDMLSYAGAVRAELAYARGR